MTVQPDPERSQRPFEFRWLDAHVPEDVWYEREGFEIDKRVIQTVGWVLQQDRDYMVVAATYDPESDNYCQVIAIPRACIITTREVPESAPDDA